MSALGLLQVVKVTGRACADRGYYVNFTIERVFLEKKNDPILSGTKTLPSALKVAKMVKMFYLIKQFTNTS